jgi:RNase H-fold protein (predicted Holliday junction resolvase)
VKRYVRRLRRGIEGVRWRFCDETLTSVAAAEIGRELGEGRSSKPDDDRAAALILETWLSARGRPDKRRAREPERAEG